MKKSIAIVLALCTLMVFTGCGNTAKSAASDKSTKSSSTEQVQAASPVTKTSEQKAIGALSPEKALDYMKRTNNLVIVDVATRSWYAKEHFTNAVNIPIENISNEEADKLYKEIPSGKPVMLHCRRGMIVPGAYRHVRELRPDIPEISYIDGTPMFKEYNEWKAKQ